MQVLQAREFRSVGLAPEGGSPVVLKRFHHPNALLARFDGARARREFAALAALHACGVSVPRPLGLERTSAGWELHLQAIPSARTLADLLTGPPPRDGWDALLARLGELLAQLQVSGWEHRDLHPGNVLIDAQGRPWLIDLQRARRSGLDRTRFLGEVVQCAAHVRELLPPRPRLCFLAAWLAALPAEHRPRLAGARLAQAIERRARAWRLASVRRHLDRWLRASSRVSRAGEGARACVRRDLAGRPPREVLSRASHVVRGPADEVRARWLGAARLHEHGVPVLRPVLYVPGSRGSGRGAWAAFESAGPAPVEAIHATLADRGLRVRAPAFTSAPGGALLLPPCEHDLEGA